VQSANLVTWEWTKMNSVRCTLTHKDALTLVRYTMHVQLTWTPHQQLTKKDASMSLAHLSVVPQKPLLAKPVRLVLRSTKSAKITITQIAQNVLLEK